MGSRSKRRFDAVPVGVIGVGSLGFHHARLLSDLPEAHLVGLYDIREERARHVANELETAAYPQLQTLLRDIEAAIIAVPTRKHHEIASVALESGCHVLIEKPISSSVEEADDLIATARSFGRLLQVGHVERFNGAVRACEPYLDRPLFLESHRLAPFAHRGTDVSVVLDLMIHDIDLILSVVRQPISDLRAVGVPVLSRNVDIANTRLEFEGGAVANITASRVSSRHQRKIRFFQPTGYISLDLGAGAGEFYPRERISPEGREQITSGALIEHVPLRGDGQEPLRLELKSFLKSVLGVSAVAVSGEEARDALAVALDVLAHIDKHRNHVFASTQAGA